MVLYALIQPGFSGSFSEANRVSFAVALVLIIFWLIKRQMPYDLIPGEAGVELESEAGQRL